MHSYRTINRMLRERLDCLKASIESLLLIVGQKNYHENAQFHYGAGGSESRTLDPTRTQSTPQAVPTAIGSMSEEISAKMDTGVEAKNTPRNALSVG